MQLAQPDRPVVCVVGEGSAQYAITALWTAVAYELPVTFLVLRNEEYAILKWFAEAEQVEGAPGLDLPKLETAAVASGYGVNSRRVDGRDELREALSSSLASSGARARRGSRGARHDPVLSRGAARTRRQAHRHRQRRAASPTGCPTSWPAARPSRCGASSRRCSASGRCSARALDIVSYASDASPYRLLPKAVVRPRDADDVGRLLGWARRTGTPLTFRSGGTSLNGQAQSDSILVDVRHHFGGIAPEDDGRLARVRPGTVLGHANRVLAPLGRRLGPDPASTDIATVGGVIANNSGGMRCGVVADSYSTVRSLTFVLPSGTTIDTAAPDAAERFARAEPELAEGLAAIRDEIRADTELSERIRAKFGIKNTTGYRLCAFLDADEPVEIFRRLLVGSEGTLAFIAEAVFETVPVPARTTVSWLHFDELRGRRGARCPTSSRPAPRRSS